MLENVALYMGVSIVSVIFVKYVLEVINDKVISKIRNKISDKMIIKAFCDEENWRNKIICKVYILIINFQYLVIRMISKIQVKCFKYSINIFIILLILKLVYILEKNTDKLLKFQNEIINWNRLILPFNIDFSDLKWVVLTIIGILGIRKQYKNGIRKSVKEECYKEVIQEYLKVKDILLDIIVTNMENEQVLYRVLEYNCEELKVVADIYDEKIFNYLNIDVFDEEYKDVEKHITSIIPQFDELREHKFRNKDIEKFKIFFESRSRNLIIRSINKKLEKLIKDIFIKTIPIINKESIIKSFMKSFPKSMNYTLENELKYSIIVRSNILKKIDKIDREIGLYKKEDTIHENSK